MQTHANPIIYSKTLFMLTQVKLKQAANHTITLHEHYAVIVPNPGTELTSSGMREINTHLQTLSLKNYPVILFPHNKYSVSFCAMKDLLTLPDNIRLAIISGSKRTRLVFGFLRDLSDSVQIFSETGSLETWLDNEVKKNTAS